MSSLKQKQTSKQPVSDSASTSDAVLQAQEQARRAQADYQNLVRRTRDERLAIIKLAAKDVISALLQPLRHLELAAEQLQDPGLNMVLQQFQRTLQDQGLEEIEVMGLPFDPNIMEAVDGSQMLDDHATAVVTQVHTKGYRLHGEVIQHAKVIIGKESHVKN